MTDRNQLKKEFEAYLSQALDDLTDSKIKEAMQYSLLIGGKRLRPLLLLTSLIDYEVNYKEALGIACAIEMIHTYSLIHDDLPAMDNDILRRGQPTCHIKFDEATAILAGDALLTQAFAMIIKSSYSAKTKCLIIEELAAASGADGMILGQHYDLSAQHNDKIGETDVVQIDILKTGKLISMPLRIAVMIASENKNNVDSMKVDWNYQQELSNMTSLGQELGIAFQIQDDILNVTSSTEILGKSVHSDSKQGKSTYLSLFGLDGAKNEGNRRFQLVYRYENQRNASHQQLRLLIDSIIQRIH